MQTILKSQSTAARRRVYFVAVDYLALQTRLSSADMSIGTTGTFTIKISKNGAAPVTPSGTTITQVDATNFKGLHYWEGVAADFDTVGPLSIRIVSVGGTKLMEQREMVVDVWEVDGHNAIRGTTGTALPNVAAEAAGGLITRGTGAGQVNQSANGQIDAKVVAGDFLTTLSRLEGLLHENAIIDQISYGDSNLIISARERIFASAAAANAATPGASNNADGEVFRNTVTVIQTSDGQWSSFKKVRAL